MTAGYVSGTIWAEKTWWNRSSPYYNASDFQQYQAFIDYIPAYQSSDPNGCLPLQPNIIQSGKSTTNSISTQVVGDATGDEELKNLLLSELRGKYDETITAYSQRYTRETNKVTKKYILARLAECYRKGEKKNFTSFLDKEIRQNLSKDDELYATTMEVENLSLIWEGKYTKAIENYKTLKERYSKNTQIVKHALFNLGYLYYFQLADSTKGEEYFAELKEKYPDDELTQQSRMLLKR
jgi:tetratricopeptide (TPR) repeat protein